MREGSALFHQHLRYLSKHTYAPKRSSPSSSRESLLEQISIPFDLLSYTEAKSGTYLQRRLYRKHGKIRKISPGFCGSYPCTTPLDSSLQLAMSEPSLSSLSTELQNSASALIDTLSSLELVTLINCEDAQVIGCIKSVLPEIGQAIDEIVPRLRRGGRVIYFGAGTSGRLGILDASECRPTFNSDQFVGIMAGGDEAIRKAGPSPF